MTRIGAFIFGTTSLVASCLLGWHLNGFVFEVFAKYLMTYEVNSDLKYSVTMVLALIVSAIATEAFYKFAFTRPKIEIILPESEANSPKFEVEHPVYDADGNKIGVTTVRY